MSERSRLRLVVRAGPRVLAAGDAAGRLWYLQVLATPELSQAAAENATRQIVTPASRGMILDARGRPLARNRTALVVSISRTALLRQHDGGRALVAKVAKVIHKPFQEVWDKTRLCGSPGRAAGPALLQRLALPADPGDRRGRHRDGLADHGAPRGLPRRHRRAQLGARYPSRSAPTPRTSSATSARSPTRSWPRGRRRGEVPARATSRAAAHRPDRPGRPRARVRRRPARHTGHQDR